jgi:hypothetical protein
MVGAHEAITSGADVDTPRRMEHDSCLFVYRRGVKTAGKMILSADDLQIMMELESGERIFENTPDRAGAGRLIDAKIIDMRKLDHVSSLLTLTNLGLGYLRASMKAKELADLESLSRGTSLISAFAKALLR